jgi:hypothetical protein
MARTSQAGGPEPEAGLPGDRSRTELAADIVVDWVGTFRRGRWFNWLTFAGVVVFLVVSLHDNMPDYVTALFSGSAVFVGFYTLIPGRLVRR